MTLQVWIYWLAGATFGGAGVFLICWGLFSDQMNGNFRRRRCTKCFYDMSSVAGLRCPECGLSAKDENALHRSRRRWGAAFMGLVAIATGMLAGAVSIGKSVGWSAVLPPAIQLRLSALVSPEEALKSLGAANYPGGPSRVPLDTASPFLLRGVEKSALSILEDPAASTSEVWIALDSLLWMRSEINQRARVGAAAVDAGIRREVLNERWVQLCESTLDSHAFAEALAKQLPMLRSSKYQAHSIASALLSAGLSVDTAKIVPDLVACNDIPGARWDQLESVTPEIKTTLLRGCRAVYFAAEDFQTKERIIRFLFPNQRHFPADNEDFAAVVRDAKRFLDSDDERVHMAGQYMVSWQLQDRFALVANDLTSLFRSDNPVVRKDAAAAFKGVRLSPPYSETLPLALAAEIRDGNDRSRDICIEVLESRKIARHPAVCEAIFASCGKVQDTKVLDRMLRYSFHVTDDGTVFFDTPSDNVAVSDASAEAALVPMLSSESGQSVTAARWLARLHAPSPDAIRALSQVVKDPSRAAVDRAAARDALLHIRDRLQPEMDLLAPLSH